MSLCRALIGQFSGGHVRVRFSFLLLLVVIFQCGGVANRIRSGKTIETPTNCSEPLKCFTGDYSVNGRVVAAWIEAEGRDSVEKAFTQKSGYVNQNFGAMFPIDPEAGVFVFYPNMRRHEVIRSDFINYLHIIDQKEFEKKFGKIESQDTFYPRLIEQQYPDQHFYSYVQALDKAHWHEFLKKSATLKSRSFQDETLIPESIQYFQALKRSILDQLGKDYIWAEKFIDQGWEHNMVILAAQRQAAGRQTSLPELIRALKAMKSGIYKGTSSSISWGIEGPSFNDGKLQDALRERAARELFALALRAESQNLRKTATAANLTQSRLLSPLGIDTKLFVQLDHVAKNSSSPQRVFRLALGEIEWDILLEKAAAIYALAPIRARLKTVRSAENTGKRYYKTIEYHKVTDADRKHDQKIHSARQMLQMQLSEIENRLSALGSGGAMREAPRGVTGYRCDPGTGLNCRPTFQGGGESASSYYSRKSTEQQIKKLLEDRDQLVQELASLGDAPTAPTYDHVTKSENINYQSASMTIEVQVGNGPWQAKTYSADAHSKEGRQGVGYGSDKRTLYYYVMTDIARQIVKDLSERARQTAPLPLPKPEKAASEPWDKEIERCLTDKAAETESLLDCISSIEHLR